MFAAIDAPSARKSVFCRRNCSDYAKYVPLTDRDEYFKPDKTLEVLAAQLAALAPESSAAASVAPDIMGTVPIPASLKVLAHAGLQVADLERIEVNEVFAAQVLAVDREMGWGSE